MSVKCVLVKLFALLKNNKVQNYEECLSLSVSLQAIDSHIVCKTVVNVETTLTANNTDAFHQIYINDMPSSVLSSIYLFADDAN